MASVPEKMKAGEKSKKEIVQQMSKLRVESNVSLETTAVSAVGNVKHNHASIKDKQAIHESSVHNTGQSKIGDPNFLKGRRIAEVGYVFEQVQQLDAHSRPSGRCDFNNMECYKEIRRGLQSYFFFECSVCGFKKAITSNRPGTGMQDVNTAVVAATNKIGIGFQEAGRLFAHLGVPYLSAAEYEKQQKKLKQKK